MTEYTNRALFTDLYELTMAHGYYEAGIHEQEVSFEYHYRKNPFGGGYAVACGMPDLVSYLRNFSFTKSDITYLKSKQLFSEDFLDYLLDLKFKGELIGVPEGSIVFPYVPILQVTGPLIIAQVIESALLNIMNFQTLIASKAARVCYATTKKDNVLEFGLRRAHGDAAITGARAAVIGGCVGTSNVYAGKSYDLNISGTHAHAWIQSFPSELEAFRTYARVYPSSTVLLVDTYDTMKSGVPNAIIVARELREQGHELRGIRIDSGDLAWLAIESAQMLDNAGFPNVKIVLSNDLDEYSIQSIINQIRNNQKASPDFNKRLIERMIWGVGTNLITGAGGKVAALGGVYKLVEVDKKPVIKLSENIVKTTNPGKKQLWRLKDKSHAWVADLITLKDEDKPQQGDCIRHPIDPYKSFRLGDIEVMDMYVDLMRKYHKDINPRDIWEESRKRVEIEMGELDITHKRFLNPHEYKVSLSDKLFKLKQDFIASINDR